MAHEKEGLGGRGSEKTESGRVNEQNTQKSFDQGQFQKGQNTKKIIPPPDSKKKL